MQRPSFDGGGHPVQEGGYRDDQQVPLGRGMDQLRGKRNAPCLHRVVSNIKRDRPWILGQACRT
jgi:hypothetical protein